MWLQCRALALQNQRALSIERLGDGALPPGGEGLGGGRNVAPLPITLNDDVALVSTKVSRCRRYLTVMAGVLLLNGFLAFAWQAAQLSSPLASAIELHYSPLPDAPINNICFRRRV